MVAVSMSLYAFIPFPSEYSLVFTFSSSNFKIEKVPPPATPSTSPDY